MNYQIFFILLSLLAGTMIPFQSAMNAQLGKAMQSPFYASLIVFSLAAVAFLIYILISRLPIPTGQQFAAAPKWSYLGGILGGSYILLIVVCAPKLGIGNVTVMVLLGQVLAAVIIDHFGLLKAQVHPINWGRFIGILLLLISVYLVKKY